MRISTFVFLFHILVVLGLFFYNTAVKKSHLPQHIQVRHFVQNIQETLSDVKNELSFEEEKSVEIAEPVIEEEPKSLPVEETKGVEKVSLKPKAKLTVKATQKPKKTKPKSPQNQKLVSLMQEALKSLDSKPGSSLAPKGVSPKKIETLATEAIKVEMTYQEKLVAYLENLLEFPEKGDVKIKLTLKKNGTPEEVSILSGKSEKNRRYIQETVTKITFPSFDLSLKPKERETFFITLTSEKH